MTWKKEKIGNKSETWCGKVESNNNANNSNKLYLYNTFYTRNAA